MWGSLVSYFKEWKRELKNQRTSLRCLVQTRIQVHPESALLLVSHTISAEQVQIQWQKHGDGKGQSHCHPLLWGGKRSKRLLQTQGLEENGLNPKAYLRDSPVWVCSHRRLSGIDTKWFSSAHIISGFTGETGSMIKVYLIRPFLPSNDATALPFSSVPRSSEVILLLDRSPVFSSPLTHPLNKRLLSVYYVPDTELTALSKEDITSQIPSAIFLPEFILSFSISFSFIVDISHMFVDLGFLFSCEFIFMSSWFSKLGRLFYFILFLVICERSS